MNMTEGTDTAMGRKNIYSSSISGFALPTVLVSSIIMLIVLVTAVSFTMAIRTALDEQRYDQLANMAAEAGTAYAEACLKANNDTVTWTDIKPLKPETDCNGDPAVPSRSGYLINQTTLRSRFVVKKPLVGSDDQPLSATSWGYVELLRKSSGATWRTLQNSDVVTLGEETSATPVGSTVNGYWTTAPSGYLLEDGSAVSRETYAALFAVIGITFGAGDGSTTFNLPDSRGKVSVAKNTADTEFNTIGETGGEKAHLLVAAELPSHLHTINHDHGAVTSAAAGDHAHSIYVGSRQLDKDNNLKNAIVNVGGAGWRSPCGGCASYGNTEAAGTHTHSFNLPAYSGNTILPTLTSSNYHNEIQPYITALAVIKY